MRERIFSFQVLVLEFFLTSYIANLTRLQCMQLSRSTYISIYVFENNNMHQQGHLKYSNAKKYIFFPSFYFVYYAFMLQWYNEKQVVIEKWLSFNILIYVKFGLCYLLFSFATLRSTCYQAHDCLHCLVTLVLVNTLVNTCFKSTLVFRIRNSSCDEYATLKTCKNEYSSYHNSISV